MTKKKTKGITLRLEADLYQTFETVARADGISLSEATRRAVLAHIEERRADPEFQESLQRILKEDRLILERLAAGAGLMSWVTEEG